MTEPLVTIAVCTRKRPEMVVKCLRSLIAQVTDFRYDIVVVENDAEQITRAAIEELIPEAAEKGVELRYFCEPEQGISHARNRCAAECRGEFLAFLDDDEWTEPDWAQQLLEVQRETGADAVCGHLIPVFEEGFPEYIKRAVWQKSSVPEGGTLLRAGTGTILFTREALRLRTPPFDPAYGKIGGEDLDYTAFLTSQGKKIVKTYRAVLYEIQPIHPRAKMRYYWERWFRGGAINAGINYKYYYPLNGTRVNAWLFLKDLWEVIKTTPALLVRPRQAFLKMGSYFSRGLGFAAFYLGIKKIGYH